MLEKLGKNHSLWVKMVVGMGCRLDVAEDIVQEMYLRMHRLIQDESKIMYNDEEVNRFFVYVTLRNMYMDYLKAKNRFTVFEFREDDDPDKMNSDQYINEDVDNDQEQGFQMIMNSVADEMSTWPRYDAILANIYFKTDYSLRDISTGSGISLTSIFNSVKGYRAKLQERLMEDYEDYINGDWNLILYYPIRDGAPSEIKGEAVWLFNLGRRALTAYDDGARWIGGEVKVKQPVQTYGSIPQTEAPRLVSIKENVAPYAPTPLAAVEEIDQEAKRDGVTRRIKIPSWDDIMFGKKDED